MTLLTRACGFLSLFVLSVVLNLNIFFYRCRLIIHFHSFRSILICTIWNWWLQYQCCNTNEISLPCIMFQIPNTNLRHIFSQYLNYTLQSLAHILLHPSCWFSDTWHYQVFLYPYCGKIWWCYFHLSFKCLFMHTYTSIQFVVRLPDCHKYRTLLQYSHLSQLMVNTLGVKPFFVTPLCICILCQSAIFFFYS